MHRVLARADGARSRRGSPVAAGGRAAAGVAPERGRPAAITLVPLVLVAVALASLVVGGGLEPLRIGAGSGGGGAPPADEVRDKSLQGAELRHSGSEFVEGLLVGGHLFLFHHGFL